MNIEVISLALRNGSNIVVGQSHFIKTVEDIGEIMASSVPNAKWGLAFNEASGPCLVRSEGNDSTLVSDAVSFAKSVGAGHAFFLVIGPGAYPINVLDRIKACPEVCGIFAATANRLEILVARTDQGAGIIGVIDGGSPKGVEGDVEKAERKTMLRKFGYKF